MNVRQQLYKKYRLEGMNGYKSAIAAGYAHNTAIAVYRNIEKRINFPDLMVKHGLDDASLLKVVKDGTLSVGMDNKPDLTAKAFVEIAFKLSGKLKEKDINFNQKNTTNVYPNRTVIFTGIDDLNETEIQDVYATEGEESPRFEQDAPSS